MTDSSSSARAQQLRIGIAVVVLALLLGWGAKDIPAAAGYAGVGPNFLPWVVAGALLLCGLGLVRAALTGGWQDVPPPSGGAKGDWRALAWVSAGVLLVALLITRAGFVVCCVLCFVLAVRGLRGAEGRDTTLRQTLVDTLTGTLIALPVFWLFTLVLKINLPGLTGTGWL
ncbi:MAG: tripartite tricarboxylate transporter TctB family protein [Aquabacterium sp.]